MGLTQIIKKITKRNRSTKDNQNNSLYSENPLGTSLQQNLQKVKKSLGNSSDLVSREICIGKDGRIKIGVLYIDGLADSKSVNDFIMKSLMLNIRETEIEQALSSSSNFLQIIKDYALTTADVKDVSNFETLFTSVLSGDTVILLDGYDQGFTVSMKGWQDRGVQEAVSQSVIRGPREAFSENIRANTALIRRKIKDPNLWLETKQFGTVTKTNVSIMYIKGIVHDEVIEEVHKRLARIEIDGILESGYIEELIQDETYTPFPTVFNTERPDVIAAGLLEGRVAILVDGTPCVLLVPALFIHFFQVAEDYFQRADIAFHIRILRLISLIMALLGPSLYIAITTFHQEMLPATLLISLAGQREGVPFPAFILKR